MNGSREEVLETDGLVEHSRSRGSPVAETESTDDVLPGGIFHPLAPREVRLVSLSGPVPGLVANYYYHNSLTIHMYSTIH